jgi:hypothetical protein
MIALVSMLPAFAPDDGNAPAAEQAPPPLAAPALAGEAPERGIRFEFRAGAEIVPALAIDGMREYTFDLGGAAYGGTAAGLANLVGPLWVGLGFSYDVVDDDGSAYSETGPITGYLFHLPLLVEAGFRVSDNGSRVIVGLEFGRAWGGFENIYYSYTDEATTRIAGAFLGLRGGYALALGRHFAALGFLGIRAGSLDQTNAIAGRNDGLLYREISAQLAVAFSP